MNPLTETKAPSALPKETRIGSSLAAFRQDPLEFMTQLHRTYGHAAVFRLGPQRFHALFHPDLLKEVFVTKADSFTKAGTFDELKRLTGEGLVLSQGEFHQRQRRILQPKLTRTQIQRFADNMAASTLTRLDSWKDGDTRDLTHDLFAITFDIIASTMFSYDSRSELDMIGQAFDSVNRIASEKIRQLVRLPLFVPTRQNREYTGALRTLDDIVFRLIGERRAQGPGSRQDLLSALMSAVDEQDGSGMTDRQLRDEIMTMFLAGHETSAHTLAWAFDFLMRHTEVETKLLEEWERVLGGRLPAADDYPALEYTQNVLWETLRLRPAGYITSRTALEDVVIGPLSLRQGEVIMISPYPLHTSDKYFDAPLAFRPERFENGLLKSLPQMAYFPFGAGPRSCIGNHFAMLEMVQILVVIGQRYRLRHVPGHPPAVPEALLTLAPKGGIRVTAERRQR
ncbi:putative cytochrome P450 [Paenibacillus mucilaginosus 3016]|uniref:Putative cytochrome P450 n=1 Tax=Paenibacillus mucilaginosus 3016 TaxID=1116391 RepID=H6NCZ2_9BACL|nr:cytochrome P450 [Paenibacillus mucilaginosus]AFC29474.1 putative cytochrome P450 [Paenibacillus mucilaginosus 3016]WFA18182.1 cytochrome P450 [Paenibacillus mucilaginosus]